MLVRRLFGDNYCCLTFVGSLSISSEVKELWRGLRGEPVTGLNWLCLREGEFRLMPDSLISCALGDRERPELMESLESFRIGPLGGDLFLVCRAVDPNTRAF